MVDAPSPLKTTWISRLATSNVVHKAIRVLQLQKVARAALKIAPLQRRAKSAKVRYRIGYLEGVLMADEIFNREIYRPAFEGKPVRTFIDVGCNTGFFVCYAVTRADGASLTGLAVDANQEMLSELQWHLDRNGIDGVRSLYGAAGFPADQDEVTFYVNPSNVASSAQPNLDPATPSKGDSHAITVPAVHLYDEWKKHAGDARIDLLKVDIEGSEADFLANEPKLLAVTDRVVLEWHKWVNPLSTIEKLMSEAGFSLQRIIHEDSHAGVALFTNNTTAGRA